MLANESWRVDDLSIFIGIALILSESRIDQENL